MDFRFPLSLAGPPPRPPHPALRATLSGEEESLPPLPRNLGDLPHHLERPFEPVLELFEIRSEEHTSELQSRPHLVCRLLLEKKKRLTQSLVRPLVRRTTRRRNPTRFAH